MTMTCFDPAYIADPAPAWERFRSECPVASSDSYGGSWLPARYDDVTAVARDVGTFTSSLGVSVIEVPGRTDSLKKGSPPIDADPPLHTWTRRLMLQAMSPQAVLSYEPGTRDLCRSLIASIIDEGRADAAGDYAQQLPVRVIGALLGVPEGPKWTDSSVGFRSILEFANDAAGTSRQGHWRSFRSFFEARLRTAGRIRVRTSSVTWS